MEQLIKEDKSVSITFKVTPTMKEEMDKLVAEKGWKFSAFVRVAVQESMDRLSK